MTAGIIEHNARDRTESPADVWGTNRGIYLGLTPQGRTNQKRPLAGKEKEDSIPRGYDYRTTWTPDGKYNLFVGEGHVTTFGPQGSGKTRKLLMPNLFKLRDWSCVVIDPKGELAAHTAVARAERENHRVFVIDPFRVIKTNYPRLFEKHPDLFRSRGFNPLAALDPDKPSFIDDAKAMAMALIQTDDARDPYWPMAAQALVKGLAMTLRLDKPGFSDSLVAMRAYLGQTPKMLAAFIKRDVEKFRNKWPAIAASLGEFVEFNADDKELGGIRRTAKTQTDWLDSPLIQRDLAQANVIDFASLKQTPTTVYLILPPEQLVTHAVWLRLMVTAALRPLLRSVERSPVPVLFMLDEFAQLGRMPIIENNIAQMRGFGVKLWTIWQDIPQMQRVYKEAWQTFMSTAEAKITFTATDVETREYFSKLSGEMLFKHTTVSSSTTKSTSSSDSWNHGHGLSLGGGSGTSISDSVSTGEQHINERVVRPYELAALDADEALIFARRGRIHRAICPQPEVLPDVGEAIQLARNDIKGLPRLPA